MNRYKKHTCSLREQITSTPKISNERKPIKSVGIKQRTIKRDIQSKRIITLSDLKNIDQHHQLLIKSLEKLMHEQTFDLTLVESKIISQVDLLIDICLSYNVIPHIDYSRSELILRGDHESCLQCFSNLRQEKYIHQYSYVFTENGEKSEEIQFNSYISLKIDEAFTVGEKNIRIEDNQQLVFDIDLTKLQVRPTKTRRNAFLVKKQFDVSKSRIPSSWSTSFLMIRTKEITKSSYESLQCVRVFQETMSMSAWQIDRIESIENYPLYQHFMSRKRDEIQLYFHGCSFASVQSIIHYGLHSTNASHYGEQFENDSIGSICLTRDALNSHLYGTRRSTDGKHYLFAVELAKDDDNNFLLLSNDDACLALPTYLIVYERRQQDLN
ncbi:hypothetical protein I4U23_010564 [Adineta vaga]|nr:hypothetical protein I4U23_010564 [Adineta vaga]